MMILLCQKQFFEKKHYWGGSIIDCFEPIFGFLMQFWFKKHRSDTWNRIGMFSELSGHSAIQSCNKWPTKPRYVYHKKYFSFSYLLCRGMFKILKKSRGKLIFHNGFLRASVIGLKKWLMHDT